MSDTVFVIQRQVGSNITGPRRICGNFALYRFETAMRECETSEVGQGHFEHGNVEPWFAGGTIDGSPAPAACFFTSRPDILSWIGNRNC
jgi:hypothetical protein